MAERQPERATEWVWCDHEDLVRGLQARVAELETQLAEVTGEFENLVCGSRLVELPGHLWGLYDRLWAERLAAAAADDSPEAAARAQGA